MSDKTKDTNVVGVGKNVLDDLIGAYNAAVTYIGRPIMKCGKCGGFVVEGYLCPNCGNDPEENGEIVNLEIRRIF